MIAAAGAGPHPIPYKLMTATNLSGAITFCFQSSVKSAAQDISARMSAEQGVQAAVQSFHANLPYEVLPCALFEHLPATWLYSNEKSEIRLSSLAAHILIEEGRIKQKDLRTYVELE